MALLKKFYLAVLTTLLVFVVGITACTEIRNPWQPKTRTIIADSISGKYLSARFARRTNDNESAVKYYESALAKSPGNPDLLKTGIELMLSVGEVEKAINYAERYIKQGGQSTDAHMLIVLRHIKNKEFSIAEEKIEQIEIKKAKDGAITSELVLPLVRVWVLAGAGNADKAISLLEQKEKDGLDSFIVYQKAMLFDYIGKKDEAEKLFDKINSGAPKSLRLTEIIINFYQRNNHDDKAQKIIERFLQDNPSITSEVFRVNREAINPANGVAELMLELSSFLYSNRLDGIAEAYANISHYLNPEFSHAKLLLAKIASEQKNYSRAIEILQSIKSPEYLSWQARLQLARIYHERKQNDKALVLLEQMAKENLNDKDALLTLGDLLVEEKNFQRAAEIYTKAIERNGNEYKKEDWIMFYARGIAFERAKEWEKAEADFFKALELNPNHPEVLNYLGYSWLLMNKNIEKAKEMLKTAVTLRPTDAHIIDSYGWALFKIGEYKAAVKYIEEANILMPQDPTTNDHLGDVYWMLGRKKEANFQWERAIIFNPEPEDRIIIEKKLKDGLQDLPKSDSRDAIKVKDKI